MKRIIVFLVAFFLSFGIYSDAAKAELEPYQLVKTSETTWEYDTYSRHLRFQQLPNGKILGKERPLKGGEYENLQGDLVLYEGPARKNAETYYFEDGIMHVGWYEGERNQRRYFRTDSTFGEGRGVMVKNQLYKVDGHYYPFDDEGFPGDLETETGYYWTNERGQLVLEIVMDKDKKSAKGYVGRKEDGVLARGKYEAKIRLKDGNAISKISFFDSNGNMRLGWVDYQGDRYFVGSLDRDIDNILYNPPKAGPGMAFIACQWIHGIFVPYNVVTSEELGNKYYLFGADGKLITKSLQMRHPLPDVYFNIDPKTGELLYISCRVPGEEELHLEAYRFVGPNYTSVSLYGFVKYDGKTYYIVDDDKEPGRLLRGWHNLNGLTYYFRNSGSMVTGIQYIDGLWYGFRDSGTLARGWQYMDGHWRYFRQSGTMVRSRWEWIDHNWKFFNHKGESMDQFWEEKGNVWLSQAGPNTQYARGWKTVNGRTYYFRESSGTMVTGWQWIDGDWKYFRPQGTQAFGWQYIGGNWYFLRFGSGNRVRGRQYIDGRWYHFRSNGTLIGSR